MKSVILCNGTPPSEKLLKKQCGDAKLVIAADGGIKYAKGARVDVFVGDLDSAEEGDIPEGCKVVELEKEKDITDAEAGVCIAIENGADSIVLLGALGGRLDHQLGNIQLLIQCAQKGVNAVLMSDDTEVYVTCRMLVARGNSGDTLSLIPFGINASIKALHGLKYPLDHEKLDIAHPRGVSNVFTDSTAIVEVEHGWVIVIVTHQREE